MGKNMRRVATLNTTFSLWLQGRIWTKTSWLTAQSYSHQQLVQTLITPEYLVQMSLKADMPAEDDQAAVEAHAWAQ